jgi:5-formyltetrahydrofolate cyclo-ligase
MLKAEIRSIVKIERQKISESALTELSTLVSKNVTSRFDLGGKTISIFLPIAKFKELNTFLLIDSLKKNETIRIAVPVSNFQDQSLKHYELNNDIQIELNNYGIPEPINGNIEIKNMEFDIVFVPLLAFNNEGYRVGYGKGFYDRFLKKCNKKCLFIGLNLFDHPVIIEDTNEFDIQLHYCVTPNYLYNFHKVETPR